METAILGSFALAYDVSNMEEGALELYYGCVGDINTTAVNPIRDTVFFGWQEGYDVSGMAANIGFGYFSMRDLASVAGSAAGEMMVGEESYSSFAELMSPEDAAKYNQWMNLREAGLDQRVVNDIILTNKGYRPLPSTYLDSKYMSTHLELFDDGASIIMTKEQYITYVKGSDFIGIPSDGTQFVLPQSFCNEIAVEANGNINVFEKALGFDIGHFEERGGLIRINIDDLSDLNLRIPSGNEVGANSHWIPGGITDGGIPEGITDLIPNNPENITIIQID